MYFVISALYSILLHCIVQEIYLTAVKANHIRVHLGENIICDFYLEQVIKSFAIRCAHTFFLKILQNWQKSGKGAEPSGRKTLHEYL